MGSWFMGSFRKKDNFFLGIKGLFGLNTVIQVKFRLINGFIWLMESVCLGPKVIPLTGAYCIYNFMFYQFI
jgi:hypothetical protein